MDWDVGLGMDALTGSGLGLRRSLRRCCWRPCAPVRSRVLFTACILQCSTMYAQGRPLCPSLPFCHPQEHPAGAAGAAGCAHARHPCGAWRAEAAQAHHAAPSTGASLDPVAAPDAAAAAACSAHHWATQHRHRRVDVPATGTACSSSSQASCSLLSALGVRQWSGRGRYGDAGPACQPRRHRLCCRCRGRPCRGGRVSGSGSSCQRCALGVHRHRPRRV